MICARKKLNRSTHPVTKNEISCTSLLSLLSSFFSTTFTTLHPVVAFFTEENRYTSFFSLLYNSLITFAVSLSFPTQYTRLLSRFSSITINLLDSYSALLSTKDRPSIFLLSPMIMTPIGSLLEGLIIYFAYEKPFPLPAPGMSSPKKTSFPFASITGFIHSSSTISLLL